MGTMSVDFMIMGRLSCRKSPNHAFHAGSKWMICQSPTRRRLSNINIAAAHCRRALRRSQSTTMRRVPKSQPQPRPHTKCDNSSSRWASLRRARSDGRVSSLAELSSAVPRAWQRRLHSSRSRATPTSWDRTTPRSPTSESAVVRASHEKSWDASYNHIADMQRRSQEMILRRTPTLL
jgi:hypothetical protein